MKKIVLIIIQVTILCAFSWVGGVFARLLHLPMIPGSIFGLIFLFTALKLRIIPLNMVDQGASFLLSQMLLFFVPTAAGIIQYGHLIHFAGLQLLIVIIISTVLVMTFTGVLAENLLKKRAGSSS